MNRSRIVPIIVLASLTFSCRAATILLESGAVDEYESPALPPCPDGLEHRMLALPMEAPPSPAISVHQAEAAYFGSLGFETEEEWDEWNASQRPRLAPKVLTLGASGSGPFTLTRHVFGFHPYWRGTAYTNYTFSLLSTIAYFCYEVNAGTGYAVTMNGWSNTPLVAWAQSNNVKVVLCATLFTNHSAFFASQAAQSNLISELIRVVKLRNAGGANIDFEGMNSSTFRAPMTAFMSNLAVRMRAEIPGAQISVCLPAVDWYGVFDVAAYNQFLDYCVMMGYDYYWRSAPNAGPVAPLKSSAIFGAQCVMKSVSNYLAAGLSPQKFLVGVPYYGYEWPTVSTNLGAATTGTGTSRIYSVAYSRALTYGRRWDTNSLTPWYTYGTYVQGWYEDTNSLAAKYDFFLSKNLAGIGIWALSYDDGYPHLWDLIAEKFATTGQSWIVRNSGTTSSFYGIDHGSNGFVAVGASGMIRTSAEGTNWVARSSGTSALLLNVTFGNGLYVAVGDAGTIVTSPDGATWTVRSPPVTNMLRGITRGPTRFVAVGNEGALATSVDGITWVAGSSGTNQGLQGVVYGADKYVAVGNSGVVLTSTNGLNWTPRSSGVANWLLDVCYGNGLFVAVGTGGRIVTSSDGITWATRTSGTTQQLHRVRYGDNGFVAVGVAGTILRSANGIDWVSDVSGVTNTLRGVAYGRGMYCVAGFEGTILTSGEYEPLPPPSPPPATEEGELTITPAPGGALSNIVIYCSAGHGFCANTNSGGWFTGRGLTNGVVEDIGNIDQLNFFVEYCLNAGATVVPFRPVGYQTNEVVLDNDDSGVTFTGTWYNSSSTIFYGSAGDVPYRYAYISTNEQTAVARYRPNIPESGFYPVYTWALHAGNRVRQRYRIRHSGGINEIYVNHRRVGAGWVWLGTYYFEAGTNGYVEISNYAPGYDPGTHVVIADAIRFGNGMGNIDRGWGVSGYEKELEASRYWIQGMVGQGMPSDLYDRPTLNDVDDNVGAPARMADYMDNEADGSFWDRLYLGFHSNADGGAGTTRGPMGLYSTGNSPAAQARQQAFASALAREITNDFFYLQNGVGFIDPWANNSADVYGAVYGEISEGYNSNMNSTIIEVAYHNNVDDARLLRDPSARRYYARSCLKGIIKHLNSTNPAVPLAFLPDPPRAPAAVNATNGVLVSWLPPETNRASGGPAQSYRVYRSTNGYGFGSPVSTTNTSILITNLTEGAVYYFRITALNAGGESLPSEVVGVRVSPMGRAYHLVVNGFMRFDRGLSPTRYFSGGGIGGNVTLVRPRQINSFDYVVQHGEAITESGRFFDSCSQLAIVSNAFPLPNYHAVYWILGEESTTNETFSRQEQVLLTNYFAGGGNLFVSGAEIAWDLDYRGDSVDKTFISNSLRAAYVADAAGTNRVSARSGSIFDGMAAFTFNVTNTSIYGVEYPDIILARNGSVTALVYGASSAGTNAAAIQYNGTYRLVLLAFPFETILEREARTNLMKRVLNFFGDSPAESPWLKIVTGNATVTHAVATINIEGTNNSAVVGSLTWTNSLTGGSGSQTPSAAWTIANVPLAVGTNVIVVRGTNAYGVAASDTVTVVRAAAVGYLATIWEDDFEDGDLAGWILDDPNAWTNTANTPITGLRSLKHNLSGVGTTSVIHARTAFGLVERQTIWRFTLGNGNWDPSTDNRFHVFLTASETNLTSSTINGYAVGVNLIGSSDLLTLWRVTGGTATALITSVLDWNENMSNAIEIVRSPYGTWELRYGTGGTFDNLFSAGRAVDSTYTTSVAFGLVFRCTSTRAGLLRMDDVRISQINFTMDSDGDGLPDAWEQQYFGDSVFADPSVDSDGDGMSNLQEYIAGLDPLDPDSVLYLGAVSNGVDSAFWFSWPSAVDRLYHVERSTDLLGGFLSWSNNIPATPPVNVFRDASSTNASKMFYRVRATYPGAP